jgi:hypothetical protein
MPALPPVAAVQEYGRSIVLREPASGQYECREATVGPAVGDRVPVLSRVQAGERVVGDEAMLLEDR